MLRKYRILRRDRRQKAKTLLTDISVYEVSIVDKPANNRPFSFFKSASGTPVAVEDGRLVVDQDGPDAVARQLGEQLGATLATLTSGVTKGLSVSEAARQNVFMHMGEILQRVEELGMLLSNVHGSALQGTLDQAVGTELAAIGAAFMKLATEFGVTEAPPEDVAMSAGLAKRGAKMSKGNLARLLSIYQALHGAQPALEALFAFLSEMGAEIEVEVGDDAEKAADPQVVARVEALEKRADAMEAFDADVEEGLERMATLVGETVRTIRDEVEAVTKAASTPSRSDDGQSMAITDLDHEVEVTKSNQDIENRPALGFDSELSGRRNAR